VNLIHYQARAFDLNEYTMHKEKTNKQIKKAVVEMPLVHSMAAGIDISISEHVVAIPDGIQPERIRKFGTMTCDLRDLSDWLKSCGITTVAMESTSVYWKPVFSQLLSEGFDLCLVNAKVAKNISGRKTDESDAAWIQKLHSCGLLASSYLPESEQESLRTLIRFRRSIVQDCSRFINRIQKSMELMNIKFHTLISDIVGQSGRAVLEAIISGERQAENFLPLLNKRIKADKADIVKSLEGNWKAEHLFTLKESYQFWKHYQERIAETDKEIELYMIRYEASANDGEIKVQQKGPEECPLVNSKNVGRKKKDKNHPKLDVRQYLKNIHGVDVLAIYGLSDIGGLELLAETGTDLKSKWETENHFVSWLNLCPNNKISGGKLISSKVLKKKANHASQAFKQAANGLQRSDHWLGDYFRRMKAKGGNKFAIVATANKLARIYYKMVTEKVEFQPLDLKDYQSKYKQAKIAYLERKLELLKNQAA
jgi:transposase